MVIFDWTEQGEFRLNLLWQDAIRRRIICIGNWSAPSTRSEKMRLTVFAATLAFLLWGAPAFAGTAPDGDGDGISDGLDNCSDHSNPFQDDTDGDDCGNLCDADYSQAGVVGLPAFGLFVAAFNTNEENFCHFELASPPAAAPGPVAGNCVVGLDDFGYFVSVFNTPPGPSGTTDGTVACP
jgi:hypothetical protein